MSWMNAIFGPKQPAEPAPAQKPEQSNSITQESAGTAPNGVVPKQESQPASPLDEHKNLWQTPENTKEETSSQDTLTPEKMFEAASKVDFSKILDPTEVAKIEAGGKEAMTALVSLLNRTAQATYGQSMVAAKKLVDSAVENASTKFTSKVPDLLRNQTAQAEIYKTNPALNNPVLAPIIEAIQGQLSKHKPQASAEELKDTSLKILQNVANLINPAPTESASTPSKSKGKKQPEEDWLAWVQMDGNN